MRVLKFRNVGVKNADVLESQENAKVMMLNRKMDAET